MIREVMKDRVPEYKDLKLTPRERLFVYFYCVEDNFNSLHAYLKAGYLENKTRQSTNQMSYRLLKKPRIREAIKRFLNEYLKLQKGKLETELFDMFYVQATYIPSDIIDSEGCLKKPIDQLTKEEQWCIKNMETKFYGKDASVKSQKIELIDRGWAMDRLSKYIEMMKADVLNVTVNISKESDEKLNSIFNLENK